MNAPEKRAGGRRRQLPRRHPAEKQSRRQPAAPGRRPLAAHESARAQVAGGATYIDDIPRCAARCMPRPSCPTWRTASCWASTPAPRWPCPACATCPGGDIPGDPMLATFVHDEPVFAHRHGQHIGQVIGVVVADTVMQARRAARKVKLDIEPCPPCSTCARRCEGQSYRAAAGLRETRRARQRRSKARAQLHGTLEVGGQEHFYLEGQVAYALPLEQDQWWSTPAPSTRARCSTGWRMRWAGQPRGHGRMPAHGRRLRRQGNAGRPHGRVGRAGRAQAASCRSSCGWTATTTSWSPASGTRSPTTTTWASTTPAASPA
jgi:hypothetical protein